MTGDPFGFLLLEYQFLSITLMRVGFYIHISYVCVFSVQEERCHFSPDNYIFVPPEGRLAVYKF